ncbi:hypothetical protein ACSBR2_007216 [Camellia fascicularis]
MERFLLFFAFFLLLAMMVEVEAIRGSYKPTASNVKLFVFGDLYADTGNTPQLFSNLWKQPYGMTYPGKPITTPVPYEERKSEMKLIQYGMNFAFGGTGVFDTLVPEPNMLEQIGYLEQLIKQKVYTKNDLESIALVSLAGKDYATYLQQHNGTIQYCSSGNSFASDHQHECLHETVLCALGFIRIGVLGIEPPGCLPLFTAPTFQHCNEGLDLGAKSHNQLLQQAVQKLRNENTGSVFVVLDLYSAFISALNRTGNSSGHVVWGWGMETHLEALAIKERSSTEYATNLIHHSFGTPYTLLSMAGKLFIHSYNLLSTN